MNETGFPENTDAIDRVSHTHPDVCSLVTYTHTQRQRDGQNLISRHGSCEHGGGQVWKMQGGQKDGDSRKNVYSACFIC